MPYSKYSPHGVHLYSETGEDVSDKAGKTHPPAVIVYNEQDEANYRALGYTEKYVHRDYPKQVGNLVAHNAEQEKAIEAAAKGAEAQGAD
jgi:hypothetical protein